MKKILSLLLALSLLFALIGCKPAGDLNAPLQPELQVQTTEAIEVITEATEWLVEWPTEATTEEIETVPEKTQPPQEEEIVDPRPHPADIANQDQQQDQYEQGNFQPDNRPSDNTSTESAPTEPDSPGQEPTQAPTQAPTEAPELPYLDPNGHYTSRDDVALYIYLYHRLPSNYITKSQGDRQYGDYHNIPTSMNIGGDVFHNWDGHLPAGYTYYECDIGTRGGTGRGKRRIVFTTSGIVYYTSDHYESFTRLY